mmetsp:Transcript_39869/g.110819  ORF Transcript_39869/g.110819 Transcript_39869/m.110819 type:complete len:429 (+) Transcript_39869:1637-2923(+)
MSKAKAILRASSSAQLDIVPRNMLQARFLLILFSKPFQILVGTAIVLNTLFLGLYIHTEVTSVFAGKEIHPELENIMLILRWCFFGFFLLEMAFRLLAEQCDFLCGPNKLWNVLEGLAVASMGVELVDTHTLYGWMGELYAFRVLRLFRLLRAMRVLRVFQFFKQLRFMVYSVLSSVVSMSWALILIFFWMYIVALYLEDDISGHLNLAAEAGTLAYKDFEDNWNGIPAAMLSLIYSISGGKDWADLASPFWTINRSTGCAYVMFVLLTVFGLLNILVGVFVQEAGELAAWDRDLAVEDLTEKRTAMEEEVAELFVTIAPEGADSVSMEDFSCALADERIKSRFEALEISATKVNALFCMLDKNSNGVLEKKEFISACMQLQGNAKALDLAELDMRSKLLSEKLDSLGESVCSRINGLRMHMATLYAR